MFQLAMQLGFLVVLLEKSWVSVRTVILSKGMRVSSKENSSGREVCVNHWSFVSWPPVCR